MPTRNVERLVRTNALIDETSPYLLQHAHNPVDWHPWGDRALNRARTENKPVFLSIGYAACHWCHVMERESFENEQIAALLNEHFISIKVDREERPDIDEIYMTAVQIMTGSGGWPMSMFLTPDLKPFYAGTYFPPEDLYGRPGFATVLRSVAVAWERQQNEVVRSAGEITRVVQSHMKGHAAPDGQLDAGLFDKAMAQLLEAFDPQEGGFGGAPKFPPSGAIALLLRRHVHARDAVALSMATRTLDKMARGGLYDQLGGGFHRYATDAEWLVPHFEKMLYDNALLAQAYLEAYQLTRNPLYRRVASETLDYVLRDMTDPVGGFHSSEDADSDGQEGVFYLWTRDEVMSVLGGEEGRIFCAYYRVLDDGNFASHEPYHARQNILHVPRDPGEVAADLGISEDTMERSLDNSRAALLAVRNRRVRPGRDDKVLTSWNGLMISALALGAQITGDPRYGAAAERAAEFILAHMTRDGELLRTYRNGQSRLPGFLDDYAFFLAALIDVYETSFDVRWIAAANDLANRMITRFWDGKDGCFYSTTETHTHLIARSKPSFDGAEPSGNSVAALALLRLAKLTGSRDYEGRARRIVEGHAAAMGRAPQAFLRMLCAADFLLHPPCEIALVGDRQNPQTAALLGALRSRFIPNRIVAALDPAHAHASEAIARIPLLSDKRPVPGHVGAYVCRNFACRAPVATPEALIAELDQAL